MPRWFFVRAPLGTNYMLKNMDFAYMARPFVYVPAVDTIVLTTLDYDYFGRTFCPFAQG